MGQRLRHPGRRCASASSASTRAPGGRLNADLTYATVGGEYLFNEGYYTSGVYLGLGWYGLDGGELAESDSEGSIGLALGLTGDFAITKRFSILVELSGHYTEPRGRRPPRDGPRRSSIPLLAGDPA